MKLMKILLVLALIVGVVIAIEVAFTPFSETATNSSTPEFKTHDDLLKEVGDETSEFGGMYISDDGATLYVYLTSDVQDAGKRQEVKQAIEDVFDSNMTDGRVVQTITAQYSMSQLYGWYKAMMPVVFQNRHVTVTDLSEGQNRLLVGVDTLEAVPEVETILASLSIPREAVTISELGGAEPISHTLRERATSGDIEGGYQISSSLGNCSLGFNTDKDGDAGFVTAGHCTDSNWYGGVNSGGTEFYQPDDSPSSNLVGEETIDPILDDSDSDCPNNMVCRRSDSAFVTLDSGASQHLGRIAKTTGLGSINVNHGGVWFRIVSDSYTGVGVGVDVDFVGRTSGWKTGTIGSTCMTIKYDNSHDRRLLCQDAVYNVIAQQGDSGAPVFQVTNSPNTNDVRLLGIAVARWTGATAYFYSPINSIYDELDDSATWDSCAPTLNC